MDTKQKNQVNQIICLMTPEILTKLHKMIESNDLRPFYRSKEWRRLRKVVLAADKFACQKCRLNGFYSKANTVHHVQYIDKHPKLALSTHYMYNGHQLRNLISLCHQCHDEIHEHRKKPAKPPLTEERW